MSGEYSYIIPSQLTIKRLFTAPTMSADTFAVLLDGAALVELDWPAARALWLGRMTLAQVLAGESPAANGGDAKGG